MTVIDVLQGPGDVTQGRRTRLQVAAKLFISAAWAHSSQDAIQVYGAWGYLKDAGIERYLRDAVADIITQTRQRSSGWSSSGCLASEPGQVRHHQRPGKEA